MRTLVIRYLLAGLLLGSLAPSFIWASSAAPADGLWHAFEKETYKTVFYLVVSDDQVDVYSPNWIPFDLDVEAGDRLEFRLPSGVDGISIEGFFEEGRFQGKWHRPHPQFRIDGEWFAERIVASENYDPWEYLRSDGKHAGPLNIAALLSGKEPPREDLKSFKGFWEKEVEARYYPLLAAGLYVDATGEFQPRLREERIQKIYSYLSDRSAEFHRAAGQLPEELVQIRKDLTEKFPWVTAFQRPVFMLSGGDFDYSVVELPVDGETQRFLLLGVDWLERETSADQRRYALARAWLYQMVAVSQPRLGAEIARRGIATWVAEQLGYSDRPQDLLFLSRVQWEQLEENLPDLCRRLKSAYYAPAGDHLEKYFFKGSRPGYVIGYAFAEAMSEGLTPEEMFSLQGHRLEERFQAFMSLKAAEGQPAPDEE